MSPWPRCIHASICNNLFSFGGLPPMSFAIVLGPQLVASVSHCMWTISNKWRPVSVGSALWLEVANCASLLSLSSCLLFVFRLHWFFLLLDVMAPLADFVCLLLHVGSVTLWCVLSATFFLPCGCFFFLNVLSYSCPLACHSGP